METKTCTKCGEVKDVGDFSVGRNQCKECIRAYKRAYWKAYYEANNDKIKAYREANKDKRKAYYEANNDKIKAQMKAYREANNDKIKAYREAYKVKLTDGYVKCRISRQFKINTKDIPQQMIDLKREELSMYRVLKEIKDGAT